MAVAQPRALAPLRAFRLAGKKVGQPPRFQIFTENHARKGLFAVKLPSWSGQETTRKDFWSAHAESTIQGAVAKVAIRG